MPKVADLVARLSDDERTALADHIGAGLLDARLAARCFAEPGLQSESVAQLLVYLSRAIRELEAARAAVVRHAT